MARKWHNRLVDYNGITFHSAGECRRWQELELLQAADEIKGLERQQKFELLPAFRDAQGKQHRATTLIIDFVYIEGQQAVAEDFKGAITEMWKLKAKLFLYRYSRLYELRIVK